MRSLGFRSKNWNNIDDGETFIVFRFGFEGEGHRQRQNSDGEWKVGEKVQIVSHSRSYEKGKGGEVMGTAEIVGKSAVWVGSTPLSKYIGEENVTNLTRADAVANGFDGVRKMKEWVKKRYGGLADKYPMYKLTLKKISGEKEK